MAPRTEHGGVGGEVVVDHPIAAETLDGDSPDARPSRPPTRCTAPAASSMSPTRNPVWPSSTELGHRAPPEGDDGRAAGHGLHHAEPNGSSNPIRCSRATAPRARRAPVGADGRGIGRGGRRCGRDALFEVVPVVDDAGDHQRQPHPAGDLDGLGGALVGMDAAEEQQVPLGAGAEGEIVGVDAVVDRAAYCSRGCRSAWLMAT